MDPKQRKNCLFITSILALTLTAHAIENEVWISPNGPANTTASGTASDPFRCPDPNSLDTVLTSVLTNNYLTIHFMAGTFHVSIHGINPLTGWKIRGAGMDNTVLQLSATNFPSDPGKFSVAGGGDAGVTANNVEVSDLTADCNFQNVSGVSCVEAVVLAGSNTKISRVKAINWGNATVGYECFVLAIDPPPNGHDGTNGVIDDCIVTQPAPRVFADGSTGISINTDSFGWGRTNHFRAALIENNLVMTVQTGSGPGNPAYFNAYGANGTVRHNQANDLIGNAVGVYRDTWSGRDVVIEDNEIDNVSRCIYFNMTSYSLTGLVVKNNVLRPAEGGFGLQYYAGVTNISYVSNFVVLDNVIYPNSNATNTTALILGGNVSASIMNNVLQGGGNGSDFFCQWAQSPNPLSSTYPPSVQLNTWVNNVNMSGTQLVETNDAYWQPGDEDTIKFTVTTPGWYRLLSAPSYAAAAVKVDTGMWNNYTSDTEFWFRVNSYTSISNNIGEIGLTRRGSYYYPYSGQVPYVRIVSDYPNSVMVYLDIYVGAVSTAREIKVTTRGPFRCRLMGPQLITTTPALYQQLNF
jgi:hypothetical protein